MTGFFEYTYYLSYNAVSEVGVVNVVEEFPHLVMAVLRAKGLGIEDRCTIAKRRICLK